MPPFSEMQQKAYAYGPKPSAIISFFSSLYACYLILRDKEKRKRVYHRIVFAMSVNSMLQSSMHFWGTWAFPVESPDTWNAAGTANTCSVQGLLLQFTFVVPFYYASLSLYSVVAIRNKFSEDVLRKIEYWLHIGVYIFPISSATMLAITKRINPAGAICWIASFPWNCENEEEIECTRGSDNIETIGWLLAGLPMILSLFFATSMMILVYLMILQLERKKERLIGKKRFLEEARRKKSRIVAWQASLYLTTFYGTYIFTILSAIIKKVSGTIYFPLSIIGHIILPLQGFLIVLVYVRLLTRRRIRSSDSSTAFSSKLTWSQNHPSSNVMMASIAAAVDRRNQYNTSTEFSIFDGTNPSDQWKEYFFSDDSIGEHFEDQCEQVSIEAAPPPNKHISHESSPVGVANQATNQ